MPRRSSSSSNRTLPRRDRPVKTAALSLSREAGRPNVFEDEWRTWTGSAAFPVTKDLEARGSLVLASGKMRTLTGVSSATSESEESHDQVAVDGTVAPMLRVQLSYIV